MNYQEFKSDVIKEARKAGLTDYELYYSSAVSMEAYTYKDSIERFTNSDGGGACFRCISGGKAGYAATELFTEKTAKELVQSALENAAVIESEDPIILKENGDTYQECTVKPMENMDASRLQQISLDLQKKIFEKEARTTEGTQVIGAYEVSERAIMNSKGLDLSHSVKLGILYPMPVIAEGGEMYDGDEMYVGDLQKVDTNALADAALAEAVSKIGADTVETKKYTCVFSGKMMGALLQTFSQVFFADTAQQGLSLLQGKEGEQAASELVTLVDDPFYADSYIQYPFDAEGSATYTKNIIENGIFKNFLHNLTTAAKAGCVTTGNAGRPGYASPLCIMPYNLYIKPGELTLEQMLEQLGDGIYVTELNGMHAGANPITGDFSLAAAGYLVENGKKTKAIKNFTVSDNFYSFLKKISMVGGDLKFGLPQGQSVFGAPSVRVEDISVAGK